MSTTTGARHRAELTPAEGEVLRLLRHSVARLVPRESELVLAIHQQLLVLMPGITRLPGAGRPVARRLAGAVVEAASADDPSRHVAERARQAGADNLADGFGPEHGRVVRHVLLQAVRAVHGGPWPGPLASGWSEYVDWLNAQLRAGTVRRPEPAPSPARGRGVPA
jgi:hypothetical protein